jgi:hypothetical protein
MSTTAGRVEENEPGYSLTRARLEPGTSLIQPVSKYEFYS